MPVLASMYSAPLFLRNGHVQTCWPVLFRTMPPQPCQRQRIDTADGDFLDIDVHRHSQSGGHRRAVVISHGLEGNSQRKYILGMAKACLALGFDVLAWNMRFCSGTVNATEQLYNMGHTADVAAVAAWGVGLGYNELALIGFSMGGNQILRWLGTGQPAIPPEVKAACAISVPCDLPRAAAVLDKPENRLYMRYFMRSMLKKASIKAARFPQYAAVLGQEIHSFAAFDRLLTAPLYGYASAQEYWESTASLPVLGNITVPVYMLAAADDPFCSPSCFPYAAAQGNKLLNLEVAPHGGHVGFVVLGKDAFYWSEQQVQKFLIRQWALP
ncbi:MAG: alpha/beta fold hydrolase [Desulfovibrionaceae bacterium]|nr:alpha/beta fold hydrolase [Desulfovibrionaceae bacterium]